MTNHNGNHKSHPAWNKGLSWSSEVRDKISQGMLSYWQIDREEKLAKQAEILRQVTLLSWRTNRAERVRILRKNAENRPRHDNGQWIGKQQQEEQEKNTFEPLDKAVYGGK